MGRTRRTATAGLHESDHIGGWCLAAALVVVAGSAWGACGLESCPRDVMVRPVDPVGVHLGTLVEHVDVDGGRFMLLLDAPLVRLRRRALASAPSPRRVRLITPAEVI